MFRESGAMAQRGEIQCAERQFALQSDRLVEREKFQDGRYIAEKAHLRFLSSYFHQGNLTASPEIRKGGFLFRSDCRVAKLVGRVIPNVLPRGTRTSPILAK